MDYYGKRMATASSDRTVKIFEVCKGTHTHVAVGVNVAAFVCPRSAPHFVVNALSQHDHIHTMNNPGSLSSNALSQHAH
jgi:hypothetical protein